MRCGQSERARSWYWAREMSWGEARCKVIGSGVASRRFLVRAWADCLPTYQNIARRTRGVGPNIYRHVWRGGEEVKGECPLCCGGTETLLHALSECPATPGVREEGIRALEHEWEGEGELDWRRDPGPLEPSFNPGGEWRGQCGWLGIIPELMLLQGSASREKLLGGAAVKLAALAATVWNARCSLVQEVEKANGVHERKVQAQRAGWRMPRCEAVAPRG